ncbi:hypothetical protein Pelo_19237 [Pelomyxa schiedti]|nr:hypothetical protein Pelo_19237 [Pelomyxa schiedti]
MLCSISIIYAVEVATGNPRPKMICDYLSCVCLALAPPQMEANTTSQVALCSETSPNWDLCTASKESSSSISTKAATYPRILCSWLHRRGKKKKRVEVRSPLDIIIIQFGTRGCTPKSTED